MTNEPTYIGAPILAVAAEDESIAAAALDAIEVEFDELPHVVDPLRSLAAGGPNARGDGNVGAPGLPLQTVKWEKVGERIDGQSTEAWAYGDLAAAFGDAKLVLEESFVTASVPHHPMETHSALAYWQNGKCFIHGSAQSHTNLVPALARYLELDPTQVVFIGEYCGGGFGSKGGAYPMMALPAYVAKKAGRPVLLRINRAEEYFVGSARHGFQGDIKLGFAADGRITAIDLYVVQDEGGTLGAGDYRSAGTTLSIVYQPAAMRWRGIPVFTNTPPMGPMRGPGPTQIMAAIEPMLDKAARQLGVDRLAIRRLNAPASGANYGADRARISSSHLVEALDKGARLFDWETRRARSGQRRGTKVTGIGVGQGYHQSTFSGFDGLLRITPDGKLHIHTGVGNLGTYSYAATSRIAAEVLGYDWANVIIERGDSRRGLPWNSVQAGSTTTFAQSRTNYVAAKDLERKLLDIAARELGGAPSDYTLSGEKVVAKADPLRALPFAVAAQRAISLGGAFAGHEPPADINLITKAAVAMIAGSGLIGVAKDTLPRPALVAGFAASFVELELDVETGDIAIHEFLTVADAGTVVHPKGIATQIKGAATMALGMATLERRVHDPRLGLGVNYGYLHTKPPSWLDVPDEMKATVVEGDEPLNPFNIKGVGEPPMGSAAAALLGAISDALGGHFFNRVPVTRDMIVDALAGRPAAHRPLQLHPL